jgi:UDP-N-acetylglucosamine 2-epimerase (non-hydrolysing)
VTIDMGTNHLLGLDPQRIAEIPALLDAAASSTAQVPPGWDGRAAERIVEVLDSVRR